MGTINETVRTVNSAVRTTLLAALMAGAGFGGWKAYSLYNEPQEKLEQKQRELDEMAEQLAASHEQVDKLNAEVELKNATIDKLEASLGLLRLRHRIARIDVVDQRTDDETGRLISSVEFYEVDDEGAPLGERRQSFDVVGDRIYIECLVAKFDDRYVEQNDLARNTAICLFQRIFGEHQEPKDGYAIDQVGSSPASYGGDETSEFEKHIWTDFWTIANDPGKAASLGIRAAHADAPSIRVRPGMTYELELRTTGEFTLRPVTDEGPEAGQSGSAA